jgi:hypothetical protein
LATKKFILARSDFGISVIELNAGEHYSALTTSLEILLIAEGALIVKNMKTWCLKKEKPLQ